MNTRSILGLSVVVLALVACDDKKSSGATPSVSASAIASSAASAAPSASAAAVASATPTPAAVRSVPSQADEAIAASKEIDKANYKKELDAIEKELK